MRPALPPLTALFALLVALLVCTPPAAAAGKTLVYCSEGNPISLQPALAVDGTSYDASSRTIYERLVDFKPGTTEVIPALASSWEISPDGLSYTFHLREGVPFQSNFGFRPTRPFNADDVLFSFQRMADKDHPYHAVSGGTYTYFASMELDQLLASIDRIDDHTVRFVLKTPSAPFLADLTMDFASIDSAEYAAMLARENRKQDLDLKPVGTGPFELVAYQPDAMLRFRAFPDYWRGKAKFDQLVFAVTPDAAVRWAKLRTGECQIMAYPNPADVAAMRKTAGIKVQTRPGLNIAYLAFNMERKPLQDVRVRRALALAINKKAIIAAVYPGSGEVATGALPPTLWAYDASIPDYGYDPAAAARLLAAAGFPKGFATELWAMPTSRPYLPDARRMAVMIQSDWARIGVRARIVTYEWGEYLKRIGQAEHATALLGWSGDNGDPDNFLATLLSCGGVHTQQNAAEFCDQPYQKLINAGQRATDVATRKDLYRKAQQILHTQEPWVPMAHALVVMPMSTKVHGYVIPATGIHEFYGVELD